MIRNLEQGLIFIFILFNLVSDNLSFYNDHLPCYPVGYCKCEFPNGLGVDLSPFLGSNRSIAAGPNQELLYFPCKNEKVQNISNITTVNECADGVSLCLSYKTDKEARFTNYGLLEESSFLWERIIDDPLLIFKHNDKVVQISLNCVDGAEDVYEFSFIGNISSVLHTNLSSKSACVRTVEEEGHSVFSTFFIVVVFIFLCYLLGGFLVLKYIRGANGWEAIPNADFWKSVYSSIRKGYSYLGNGCRQPEIYDTI